MDAPPVARVLLHMGVIITMGATAPLRFITKEIVSFVWGVVSVSVVVLVLVLVVLISVVKVVVVVVLGVVLAAVAMAMAMAMLV